LVEKCLDLTKFWPRSLDTFLKIGYFNRLKMFGSNRGMEETLFQLKFCSKQLARLSKKAEKEQKKEEGMIKKALTQGDVDRARIYAENAVRSVTEQPCFNVRGIRIRIICLGPDPTYKITSVL
jgi:hypothetical protein